MRNEQKKRRRRNGFTLVELMVVIVIIGLLATIVAINVLPSGDQARVTRARADISTIQAGLDLYKLQNGRYPSTSEGLGVLVQGGKGGGYLKGSAVPKDPWNHAYNYRAPGGNGRPYDITSDGPGGKGGEPDGANQIASY